MFKRSIEFNIVKPSKAKVVDVNSEEAVEPIDYTKAVQETVRIVAANAIIGMAVFVGLDTVRQVIVKITPGH